MSLIIPEKILNQHLVVLGKTGAGKSSALRHIVEHLLDGGKRVCIVDIKGDWWGLKLSADGRSPGYPVVAFGDFRNADATDVPINAHAGADVAELVASGNRPCIIGFRGWMPSDVIQFWIGNEHNRWKGFASTLFAKNEGELYVVISECHNFAPKGRVEDPKSGRMLHWTNRLLSEGRGLGMTFLLDSQRPQKVHNDTLTSCETLVAMRVTYPADRDAVADWIKGCGDKATGQQVLDTLAQMSRGEGWVWSPENDFGPKRVQFPMFGTFDSFAPAQLQKQVSRSGWADVNLEEVKAKLAAVVEEHKANDPTELKARIRQLETDLDDARNAVPTAITQEVTGYTEEELREAAQRAADDVDAKWAEHDRRRTERFNAEHERMVQHINALTEILASVRGVEPPPPIVIGPMSTFVAGAGDNVPMRPRPLPEAAHARQFAPPQCVPGTVAPQRNTAPSPKISSNGALNGTSIKILTYLSQYSKGLSRAQVAAMCGIKPRGGNWNTRMTELVGGGYAVDEGGILRATREGVQYLSHSGVKVAPAPRSTQEVVDLWSSRLNGTEMAVLRECIRHRGGGVSKERAAEVAGVAPRGGNWNTVLTHLRSAGLIVVNGGMLAANRETLFL